MYDFSKILKKYNILYCEDAQETRMAFDFMVLGKIDNIIYAEDGKIGLEKYQNKIPDIIITDIGMPNLNGLEMVSKIRESNKDIPIIITTSIADQENLIQAINIGIDEFLVKPVGKTALFSTLEKVVRSIEDKKMANEYRKKIEIENLQKNTKQIISQISEIFVEPIIILNNGNVKYVNTAFEEFMGAENIKLFKEDSSFINSLLEKKDGFCHSIKELSADAPYKNKISTNINNKRIIFQVVVKKVQFEGQEHKCIVYVLQDITVLEYQKLKIENYSFRLENYLIKSKYKINKVKNNLEEKVKEINKETKEEKRFIDEKEESLLRKSHVYKISANSFLENLDSTIFADLDELIELEDEIDETLYDFTQDPCIKSLQSIISKLDKYAFVIKNLQEFDELAQALFSTRDILSVVTEIDDKKAKNIKIFLENIFVDLKSWRNTIFVKKDTNDIHYLDSSLFSSCLQMELSLTGVKADDDEDDFELF